jgi:hypothetical protein
VKSNDRAFFEVELPRDELGRLGVRDRAFAVCAVRALGAGAEPFCARRQPALRRYAALLARDRERFGREVTRLDRAVPAGIDAVHPSWYRPPPPSAHPAAQTWLERRSYGHLVEMNAEGATSGLFDRLERLDAAELAELLIALGRRRVATAFSGAPRAALAQLCARLGEPAASELLAHVRTVAPSVGPDEVHAAQRALFSLGVDSQSPASGGARGGGDDARTLYLRTGASWLGPALAARGGDRLRRVAQRLARPVGEQLEAGARSLATEAEHAAAASAASAILSGARRR